MELPSTPTQVFMKHEGDLQRALTREQMRTINVLRGRSRNDSDNAREKLSMRIVELMTKGRSLKQLATKQPVSGDTMVDTLADYISTSAPIVIHLTEQTLEILLTDTYYRSSFETGTTHKGSKVGSSNNNLSYLKYALGSKFTGGGSYQSNRESWESECFLGLYNDLKSDFERPKYGALNFLNAPSGVASAHGYGQLYLKLQPHVRKRITVSTGDTSSSRCLGVLDYCNHVLMYLSDTELSELIRIVTGEIEYSSHVCKIYREIQIHGEINLSLDVASLHIPETADYDLAVKFSQHFNIPVVVFMH